MNFLILQNRETETETETGTYTYREREIKRQRETERPRGREANDEHRSTPSTQTVKANPLKGSHICLHLH